MSPLLVSALGDDCFCDRVGPRPLAIDFFIGLEPALPSAAARLFTFEARLLPALFDFADAPFDIPRGCDLDAPLMPLAAPLMPFDVFLAVLRDADLAIDLPVDFLALTLGLLDFLAAGLAFPLTAFLALFAGCGFALDFLPADFLFELPVDFALALLPAIAPLPDDFFFPPKRSEIVFFAAVIALVTVEVAPGEFFLVAGVFLGMETARSVREETGQQVSLLKRRHAGSNFARATATQKA